MARPEQASTFRPGGESEGWEAQLSRFFPLPPQFSFVLPSLGGSSRGIVDAVQGRIPHEVRAAPCVEWWRELCGLGPFSSKLDEFSRYTCTHSSQDASQNRFIHHHFVKTPAGSKPPGVTSIHPRESQTHNLMVHGRDAGPQFHEELDVSLWMRWGKYTVEAVVGKNYRTNFLPCGIAVKKRPLG